MPATRANISHSDTTRHLQRHASLLANLRGFMQRQGVLEVAAPAIRSVPAADAHIKHIKAGDNWLHSSPEASLKFLLARVQQPIYYLGPVFRDNEQGSLHNPEFTMLEWYMPSYDTGDIMQQLAGLLEAVGLDMPAPQIVDYGDIFQEELGMDAFCTDYNQWRVLATRKNVGCHLSAVGGGDHWQVLRDLLLASCIIPKLGLQAPVLLHGFPHQPSLQSRQLPNDPQKDDRFELIVHGVEIADGCRELNDAKQLQQRQQNPDPLLQDALQQGLPDCIGVALGVDRLLAALRHQQGEKLQLQSPFKWQDGKPP